MPEHIPGARAVGGMFERQVADNLHHRPPLVPVPPGGRIVRMDNAAGAFAALLLLTQLRMPQNAVDVPGGGAAGRPGAGEGAAVDGAIMGVRASPQQGYTRLPAGSASAAALHGIANSVVTVCAVNPPACRPAVVGGVVAAVGGAALAGLSFFAGRASVPPCQSGTPPTDAPNLGDVVMHALPDADREQVWRAVLNCGGDHDCTVSELRAVLEKLPPDQQQRLLALSPEADEGQAPAPVGWPRGAHAQALVAPVDWLDHLADVLALQISPEAAAFELDIAAIVDATRVAAHARHSSDVSPGEAVNQARLSTIADRFAQAGLRVQPQPFELAAHTVFGFPYTSRGQNLLVELNGEGPTQRTLMLVAHGDVAGADAGSTGALDNATGVAALLAVARQLNARGLPPGVRVQFLITDQEELGLHGAKAYVNQCRAAESAADVEGSCPTVALNVDMLGSGNVLTLSGTDQHDRYRDGDSGPRGEEVTVVSATERRMTQLLRNAATAVGLRVLDTPDWTLQSDHIPFQRGGVSAVGMSAIDPKDFPKEQRLQRLREDYLKTDDEVNWSLYPDYRDGTLGPEELARMEQAMARADEATAAYQAAPLSDRQLQIHGPRDQQGNVDTQRAMLAVHALQDAVAAWVAEPPHAPGQDR